MYLSNPIKTFLILTTVFVSGCMGLGVGLLGNDEETVKNPHIHEKGILTEGSTPWVNAEDLHRYWGSPDSLEHTSQAAELWQYNFGLRWNGVGLLVAFIPLPLMIPVGHEYIEFGIENGLVVKARTKEHTWIAMYGCAASAIPHAAGAECIFENKPERPSSSFSPINHPGQGVTYKINVINATNSTVTIFHTNKLFRSKETRFTLEPHQSRHILSDSWGETVAINSDAKTLTHKGGPFYSYIFDSSIFYLIIGDHIFPVPPKYWNNWETHIEEIINVGQSSK